MLSVMDAISVFHAGEVALQAEAGVAERMARIGTQVIRDAMPEQHRSFFELLPFLIIGSVDRRGQPTASLLAAPPGFASSPDPTSLRVDALPIAGDPLEANLHAGAAIGVLGIQAHTRRRNRANGSVLVRDELGFTLAVHQSFGNCPKYIHPREALYVGTSGPEPTLVSERLDARARALIAHADTFFIASAHPEASGSPAPAQGVDVSHRGGPIGFVHFTDDTTFSVPDYRGNNFYNTLGNLQLNPAAGLLFIERTRGDLLQLDVTTELIAGAHPHASPADTGRLVRFNVQRMRFFPRASPLRFEPAA